MTLIIINYKNYTDICSEFYRWSTMALLDTESYQFEVITKSEKNAFFIFYNNLSKFTIRRFEIWINIFNTFGKKTKTHLEWYFSEGATFYLSSFSSCLFTIDFLEAGFVTVAASCLLYRKLSWQKDFRLLSCWMIKLVLEIISWN